MDNPRKPSKTLSEKDAAMIKKLILDGWLQSRIAAKFDVNIGRISEIKTGKTFDWVQPEQMN